MRAKTALLALLLVSGCTHKAQAPAPAHPPAAAAAKAGATAATARPGGTAPATATPTPAGASAAAAANPAPSAGAAADTPLPKTVDLVHFDLKPYGSGQQDYQARSGGKTVEVHRARSAAGLAHAWVSTLAASAYAQGDTYFTFKGGQCDRSTGRIGQAAFASLGEPYIGGQTGVLAPLALGIAATDLHRTGTATVDGVPVTTYGFKATRHVLLTRAEETGTVALDAHHEPLRSQGRIVVSGGGGQKSPPLTWTFTTSHLRGAGGAVGVSLPAACQKASAAAAEVGTLPLPKGAKKTEDSGGLSAYMVPESAAKTRAFLHEALPGGGWTIDKVPSPMTLTVHKGKTHLIVTILPIGKAKAQVSVMDDD